MRSLETEAENKARLAKLGWLSEGHDEWSFLQWSAEKKQLVKNDSLAPVKVSDAVTLLDKIRELVEEPGLVVRFHPTRPLTGQMTGESLTCCLQVSIREPRAATLYDSLASVSGLACTQLIGMGLRKDRMGRSALAQAIAKSM